MSLALRPVILSGNSSWNIVNFRVGLVAALRGAGFEPVVIAPIDPAGEPRMAMLDVRRFTVDMDRSGLNPFRDLKLFLQYRRLLREIGPAAYLGYTIKPNIYGSLAARLCGVPAVPNISGLGTVFLRGGLLGWFASVLYRRGLRGAPIVFFQNGEDLSEFVERKLVRPDQARLLPGSGIDLDRFAPAQLPPGPVTFLLIGRLLGDKGVREFVEAARTLRREGSEARFQLLGPLDAGNRTAITRAELDSWVEEGTLENLGETDDVRPFIARCHAVVLPSYREGLPRSLLEGAAMGRPLIASDVPGCRDVVDDGVNGILCAPHDAASLADAMRRFSTMRDKDRSTMGAAGRAKVQAQFSEERVIEAYLQALDDVIAPQV